MRSNEQERDVPVLGLEKGIVQLRDYTPVWADLFESEAAEIRRVLGDLALDVQHVGSTSVPGLKAKPILDIAVAVSTLDDLPQFETALGLIGYEYAHWAGIENNLVFGKGVARTHLVHVVEQDSVGWRDYIQFRTVLRENPEVAREYERIKVLLAQRYPDNRATYTDEKKQFINRVLAAQ